MGGGQPGLGLWQRVLVSLPRLHRERRADKAPLGERLRGAVLKPADPGAPSAGQAAPKPLPVEELEAAVKSADDKERLVGLLAAPFAAMIGILVINDLIAHDPAAHLKNGAVNRLHVSVTLYHNLELVLLGLSVLMLVTAWFRKRMFLGVVMAMYGLAIFNLKYWGFGVPFVLAAAWLLVRSYRLQRDLRVATSASPTRTSGGGSSTRSGPNKRYTPRAAPPKRLSNRKPHRERRAG